MTAYKEPSVYDDSNYWIEKLAAFLHDPPDKALSIWGHVKRGKLLQDELYVSADESLVKKADLVASGLDRTFLPEKDNQGFIDFIKFPVITHPTGRSGSLTLGNLNKNIGTSILHTVQEDERFFSSGQPEYFFKLFHYFRHVLPYSLAKNNAGGLSWRWLFLPADTRIPDHSIWHHCALTSALYSCYRLSDRNNASIVLFSITPVQDFIARSRKLRDHWTASLLLSWLTSEGVKLVICKYGSDHIVYPSPIGQPLIESFLDSLCNFGKWKERYFHHIRAATLPNKFIFLAPEGREEEACREIKDYIRKCWLDLACSVKELVKNRCFRDVPSDCLGAFENIFRRQTEYFWEFHWCSVPLLDEASIDSNLEIFPESIVKRQKDLLEKARNCGLPYLQPTEKFFYALDHDLVQRGLAAEKMSPVEKRPEESGIKCHLHPDLEALRFSCLECEKSVCSFTGKMPDPNPRPTQDPCWQKIRKGFSVTEFKSTERLCSIALIKRLACRALEKDSNHPLCAFFRNPEAFPSTTEIALVGWFDTVRNELDGLSLKDVAEYLHRQDRTGREKEDYEIEDIGNKLSRIKEVLERLPEDKKPDVSDRYYVLVAMDGDRMGRLLAGGFSAHWRDVLHPELVRRLEEGEVAEGFWPCFWKNMLDTKRALSPSVHAAISKALADFALYTVPYIVSKYSGELIYAGGDDVCAVFPAGTAIDAVVELAKAYNWFFVRRKPGEKWITENIGNPEEIEDNDILLIHLGYGEEISISAGVLIVHHKWPLRAALERVHGLLELAKDSGRAALALEFHRRAGERRTFVAGFRNKRMSVNIWNAFKQIVQAFSRKDISSSFAHGLREFEDALLVLNDEEVKRFVCSRFTAADEPTKRELSRYISSVILGARKRKDFCYTNRKELAFDILEIANFLAETMKRSDQL